MQLKLDPDGNLNKTVDVHVAVPGAERSVDGHEWQVGSGG